MKETFSKDDETEKKAMEGRVPRSSGDVGSWGNANIGYDNMYTTKYGFCDIMKRGMAFKCNSPTIVRPGAFCWTEY